MLHPLQCNEKMLGTQELSNLLWSLGLQPSREEVEDLLVEMDADRFINFIACIPSETTFGPNRCADCYQDKGPKGACNNGQSCNFDSM